MEGLRSSEANRYVVLPGGYYDVWERAIADFSAIDTLLTELSTKWLKAGRQFAWRGVADASYPLHSSLYRRLTQARTAKQAAKPPDEAAMAQAEMNVLIEAHRWGLHNGPHGRLSILNQLAALQHFGAPTRLIDVSLNAYIGLWFAVEKHDDRDGRLFAIDITSRLINEQAGLRDWEDRNDVPWPKTGRNIQKESDDADAKAEAEQRRRIRGYQLTPERWTGETFAWKPPPFERRIAAQNGAFLLAGVPKTRPGFQVPQTTATSPTWPVAAVRSATSVPLRLHKADPAAGGVRPTGAPAYTFRIEAAAKEEIRARLQGLFGYSHRTIYPDLPGFADFAMSDDLLTRGRVRS